MAGRRYAANTREGFTNSIRIVLVETSHGGNIGAVARAMKTMALSHLVLVRPQGFPSAECTARACGADDLLATAQLFDSLKEAISDCHLVIGSSARRQRTVTWPELDPHQTAQQLLTAALQGPVALVFGRESSGLSNAELDYCHALAHIPSVEQFSSLNLAAAVQIFAYELRVAQLAAIPNTAPESRVVAPMAELESMIGHLAAMLGDIGFADPEQSPKLVRRLRRLFYRAHLDRDEINILRGLFSASQRMAKIANKSSSHREQA